MSLSSSSQPGVVTSAPRTHGTGGVDSPNNPYKLHLGPELSDNPGSVVAATVFAINPSDQTDNSSTVFHFAVGDGTKYHHMNGQGVGVVGGLYFAVEDSTTLNGVLKMTVNQTGQNDGTLQASSSTGKTPGLYLRAISHIRLQAGFQANQTFDSASFAFVQSPRGLAVQDTGGSATYFWVTPEAGGKIGFYGTAPAVKQTVAGSRGANAALASLLTALATMGIVTDSSTA